jgi:S-adenosylmethionine hydrolase
MKGVILSINPQARLIDLTHDIPPQDIAAAAFTLLAAYKSFPAGTVHVAVVDPGVGSSRRAILVVAGGQRFVGPDNGIFSYLLEREPEAQVFHLTRESYFRQPVSATFHGRDVFSPVAAALSKGVSPAKFGVPINDPLSLPALAPQALGKGRLQGRILHIDHFGNCVTSFTQPEVASEAMERGVLLNVKRTVIKDFRRFFSDEGTYGEKLFTVWGSAGFLEIAAENQSAATLLRVSRDEPVVLSLRK